MVTQHENVRRHFLFFKITRTDRLHTAPASGESKAGRRTCYAYIHAEKGLGRSRAVRVSVSHLNCQNDEESDYICSCHIVPYS